MIFTTTAIVTCPSQTPTHPLSSSNYIKSSKEPKMTTPNLLPKRSTSPALLAITFESYAFPSVYLRLDGRNVTKYNHLGSDNVTSNGNGNDPPFSFETFLIDNNTSDNLFPIKSASCPNVYVV
ncbi:hypothetical protein BJ875DRAFT_489962 [Amylocarpus encephaloides]|uniref:Uncharacterized protein n=1 Tax=Amylocarpus encephaloides TaxID=45428 RepID=A0A9P7Y6Y1_9HELO|nr:hypothetical protein BJ875DRAFT_489962 [Amylocarpus encephaloides]